MRRIYLDHAATTPLAPAARQKMAELVERDLGNPSSLHAEGRFLQQEMDRAREAVSRALGVSFGEVIFTGSGTEAANLAVVGLALAAEGSRSRILLSSTEHHSVLETRSLLGRMGYQVELIRSLPSGSIDLDHLGELLDGDVLLAAVMDVNNETGVRQPLEDVARMCGAHEVRLVVDAVQSFGKLSTCLHGDVTFVSGHKVGGPKGVGALTFKPGVKLKPVIVGGSQERELRAGTPSVVNIAGFGVALTHPLSPWPSLAPLQAALESKLGAIATASAPRVESILNMRFPGVSAESLLIRLDREGISASAGAACSSGSIEPSHVLLAMGLSETQAKECVRFSIGHETSVDDLQDAEDRIVACVSGIRGV